MSVEAPKFLLLHRNKFLTIDADSLADMAAKLRAAADELAEMAATGMVWLMEDGVRDDYAHLGTDDPAVAEKFGFQDAAEFYGEDSEDDEDEGDEDDLELDDAEFDDEDD